MANKCPICGEFNETDNFTCPECGKPNICGKHYSMDFLVCSACAKKKKKPKPKKQEKQPSKEEKIQMALNRPGDNSPFYFKEVTCPICENINQMRQFKTKIFAEKNVDFDKHVQAYGWKNSDFSFIHPPLYFFWHCHNCNFTDNPVDFENPTKEYWNNFQHVKELFVDKIKNDKKAAALVQKLSEAIDYDKMTFLMSIKLHFMAIFIQELPQEQEHREFLKLGRYYLRNAWLFRDLGRQEKGPEKVQKLTAAFSKLKQFWPEIPVDEDTNLRKAAEYMEMAFKLHPGIKSPAAELDLVLMISGIYFKLKEYEQAANFCNMVIQRGQKSKAKLEERIKTLEANENSSADEIRKLDIVIKKGGQIVSKARDLLADINVIRLKEQKEKALKILKKFSDETPAEEKREALSNAKIDKRVIDNLVPEEKKKKFLGLF